MLLLAEGQILVLLWGLGVGPSPAVGQVMVLLLAVGQVPVLAVGRGAGTTSYATTNVILIMSSHWAQHQETVG